MKTCDECGVWIKEKNIVCPFCLRSVSDKQLPIDELIKIKPKRKDQEKYEFKSDNFWKNKHKIR